MNALPIVQRELRVVSRKPWMYWLRLIFALAGMIAALAAFYEERGMAKGGAMLWVLSVVTMALALFCGGLLTADCISAEKREDTLGLLFLTNLKGYDVVAGKIAIHAVTTACGLVAVFPVFFLPILAGGVSWAETLRVLLAVSISFVFALAIGIWISTRSRDAKNSIMVTLTVLMLIVFVPLLWPVILDEFFRLRPSMAGIVQLSPGMLMYYARDFWYFSFFGKAVYWSSIGLFAIGSFVLTGLASSHLPRVWGSDEPTLRVRRPRLRWWRAKPPVIAARRRLQFFSSNPFREFFLIRFKDLPWAKIVHRVIILLFAVLLLFSFERNNDEAFVLAVMILFALQAVSKFVFAFDATRALNEDKRSSALHLLLITPLGEAALADAQSAAFRTHFRRHVRRLFWMTLAVQITAIVNDQLRLRGDDLVFFGGFLWGAMIWTWSDFRTISWLGMHHAVKQSTHLKATLHTLAGMLLWPWSPYLIVLVFMAESRVDEAAAGLVTIAWAIGSAIYRSVRSIATRSRVLRELRLVAAGA